MHKVDVAVGTDLFEENEKIAQANADRFERAGVTSIDLMGAIGSGKTLLIEKVADRLLGTQRVGVIVGDVTGDSDYRRIREHHVPVVNINTGKECHLDAHLIEHALDDLDLDSLDVLFIENIGNLVCPADFMLGCNRRGVVISVTEGDDMVKKHPLIFQTADFIVVNKIDLAEHMGVDVDSIIADIEEIAPKKYFLTDARHDEGIDELVQWLLQKNE